MPSNTMTAAESELKRADLDEATMSRLRTLLETIREGQDEAAALDEQRARLKDQARLVAERIAAADEELISLLPDIPGPSIGFPDSSGMTAGQQRVLRAYNQYLEAKSAGDTVEAERLYGELQGLIQAGGDAAS